MKLILPAVIACLALCRPALGYAGTWHVVQDLSTATCYRVHGMEPRDGWRDFGEFNTFRMAGAWTWRHRDICRSSPVFE